MIFADEARIDRDDRDGALLLQEVQLEGKQRMTRTNSARGQRWLGHSAGNANLLQGIALSDRIRATDGAIRRI